MCNNNGKEIAGKAHGAGIVDEDEIGFGSEVRFLELVVGAVLSRQFLDVRLVCGFGEPALLVQEGEDAHWLGELREREEGEGR